MSKKSLHPLDVMAIQWEKEEEQFFLDVPYSSDYFLLKNPIGILRGVTGEIRPAKN
jgi:hypothetical protein